MKQKTIGILSLMTVMLFAMTTAALAVGEFKIQYPQGTNIFEVDSAGNVNATGQIYEKNILLGDTYWNLTDVATPSNGDTTHISTADQIYDWVIGLGYVTGWDTLDDMVLNSGYIYVGNASNEPQGVAVSGDATISNTGVVTVVDSSHLHDADNLTGLDALNGMIVIAGENVTSGTVADARIAATIARDSEVAAVNTTMRSYVDAMDMFANVTGTVVDTKYCTYNASNTQINCQSAAGGLSNVVEDTTPQLGGNLDLNGFSIEEPSKSNFTITSTGNVIIVLV